MKRLVLSLLVLVSVCAFAQNTWEMPKEGPKKKELDAKYAAGVIPMKDGLVNFEKTFVAKGKTRKQVYDIVKKYLQDMTTEPNQLTMPVGYAEETVSKSRIVLDEEETGTVAGRYDEWLVFRSSVLALDRTEMKFVIIAKCSDEKAEISISRIHYIYDKNRSGAIEDNAENIITDEYGLNKKKTKLAHIYGKFRAKTIDRVNYLFNEFEQILK
ncbi:MAG: DUF4468 domain-containing protein [Prevotella sp.]|nr:DUF4468 domain-containing protein [Candidatus Equicola faecalis]